MGAVVTYRPPGSVLRRILHCVLLYFLVFELGWLAIGMTTPRSWGRSDGTAGSVTFSEAALGSLASGASVFLIVGLPSLVIVLIAGLTRKGTDLYAFRILISLLLILPLWPFMLAGTPLMLFIQFAAQVVYAMVLMPVPLLPPPISVEIGAE
ncbi:hypothetical protein Q3V23_22105 [Streptomyces sp. VNUA116]|uniref:hypothetical protein n=1 Tax=Streptomyces sp. VNUA116 TaxID=3062449 RepID=UPI002676AA50|nr:hypothetical protein [Streptomyces sp. VNUA116]WKU46530.1 hypothetical protein Q3V23_22105 [Streptomyces sp. VNUA116]